MLFLFKEHNKFVESNIGTERSRFCWFLLLFVFGGRAGSGLKTLVLNCMRNKHAAIFCLRLYSVGGGDENDHVGLNLGC